MRVNSFFCGAGGFDLGFLKAGFDVVGAWDFDKYAVESYNHNIGGALQANVLEMKGEDVSTAEGWLFGFPCQDISNSGKQKGMIQGETRSGLFFEIMRLLGEVTEKPEWILAENVKAVKKFIPLIEEEYRKAGYRLVYQLRNSKYSFVPQNRERYFLMGVRDDVDVDFEFPDQQKDYIPKLSSILEEDVDEKYYIDDLKALKIIEQAMEGLKVKQATKKGYDIAVEGDSINISHPNSTTRRGRVGKQVVVEPKCFAMRGRYNEDGSTSQHCEFRKDDITSTLTGVQKDNMLMEPCVKVIGMLDMKGKDQWKRVYDKDGLSPTLVCSGVGYHEPKILTVGNTNPSGRGMNENVYDSEGLSPTLTTNKGEGVKILKQYRVRKLTPREYARLQGFPDSYEQIVSNSQFYKQMGNAVTVNTSCEIARAIKEQFAHRGVLV